MRNRWFCGRFAWLPNNNSAYSILFTLSRSLSLFLASLWIRDLGGLVALSPYSHGLSTAQHFSGYPKMNYSSIRITSNSRFLRLIHHHHHLWLHVCLFFVLCTCLYMVCGIAFPVLPFLVSICFVLYLVNLDTLLRFNTFVVFILLLVWTNVRGISICLTLFSF